MSRGSPTKTDDRRLRSASLIKEPFLLFLPPPDSAWEMISCVFIKAALDNVYVIRRVPVPMPDVIHVIINT